MKRKACEAIMVGLLCSMGLSGCSSSIEGIEAQYPPGKTEMARPRNVSQFESKAQRPNQQSFTVASADDTTKIQSPRGRILAAGGYITGAVAGS